MVTYVIALRKKREKEHVEKEELIKQQNILLKQKVEERTRELELERKRSEELLIQASQKQMAELELQSLRAQLNPHFMFNCLTAIQELILKEDFENSQTYLARFAKLLRMLVENTETPFTPLQKEIDLLELYLSLEKLRLPDLRFSITADPSINKDKTLIPNMILQPYIENALWHGLSPKTGDKKLEVNIQKQNGNVIYNVKDNGVGRKRSSELKSLYRRGHKSKGVELLTKRFKLLSEEYGSDITTEVIDVMNNGKAGGTEVAIIVPDSFSQKYQK
jgi:LytS/YehU family sensor histidine kinase